MSGVLAQTPLGDERLLIIQPWFSAKGHPAQSLYNTMRNLRAVAAIDYLISDDRNFQHHVDVKTALGGDQRLFKFDVPGSSLLTNTARGLWSMARLLRRCGNIRCVFFFDMHLVAVSALWPLLAPWLNVRQMSLLYLAGPERIVRHGLVKALVRRLLLRQEVVLCLRTPELQAAWAQAFPDVAVARIRTIPSLEIALGPLFSIRSGIARDELRFGILGQLRRGKSIETLAPLFAAVPALGVLKVAGSFNSPAEREALHMLAAFPGFEERYLEDDELLQLAAHQDYIVMFYDNWDTRMESAVLYLAARANRPVLAYAGGWLGRMVQEFGCGIATSTDKLHLRDFLARLPLPGSSAYAQLLEGVGRLRSAHEGSVLRPLFLDCVGFHADAGTGPAV
ncbi:MAG: hypothetical protein ABI605_02325 [Rhizobacter sp.]